MPIGFDARSVDALVVHGYPLEGLTVRQCFALERVIAKLGSGLVAVPHGDLSETSPSDAPAPCTLVIGALVARAGTAAQEDATTQSATVNEASCDRARASFEAAQPLLDPLLEGEKVSPGAPALLLVAAGPMATACLAAERASREGGDGSIQRSFGEEDTAELAKEVTADARTDRRPVRLSLRGSFVLSARFG